jgi:hypothetical protein
VLRRDLDGSYVEVSEDEYVPLGQGWAAPANPAPLTFKAGMWPDHPGLSGISLEFEVRGGRLQCVGIRSTVDGPEITSTLLRKLEPAVRQWSRFVFLVLAVRLIELEDGTVAGEKPGRAVNPEGEDVTLDELIPEAAAFYDEKGPRPGRRPLTDEHLDEVASLYREAEALGQPRGPHIEQSFPGYSPETIRNWVRRARERGKLGAAPGPRLPGEKPTTKGD